MKKVISTLLASSMLFAMGGCTQKKGTEKLSWYVIGEEPTDSAMVMEKVNEITKDKIGAEVELIYLGAGDFSQKLHLMMASNEQFDLTFTCSWANPYFDGARNGGFLDISEMLDDYPALKESMPEYMWNAAKVDDGIYAVPNYQATATVSAVYLRKDLVEKYNFNYSEVKNVTDLEPFFDTILANEPGIYPVQPGNTNIFLEDPYQFEQTSVTGISYDTKTDKIVYTGTTPEMIEAYKKVEEWYDKGYIRSDIATGTTSQDIKNGLYAATVTSGHRPGEVENVIANTGYEWIPIPVDDEYHMSKDSVTSSMTAISATSKNPEKAMELLQLVNTNSELINLMTFGIEGTHYDKIGENKIKLKDNSGYTGNSGWMFGNMFNTYLLDNQSDTLWEDLKAANDNSAKEKYLEFLANTKEFKTILANIDSFTGEYYFGNGTLDVDSKIPEFEERLKNAGVDELISKVKAQIEEFEKNN